jgi:hypothetical protein
VSPSGTITSATPTFTWQAAKGARTYLLQALQARAAERTEPTTALPARRHAKGRNEPTFDVRTTLYRLLGADLSQIHGSGRIPCFYWSPSAGTT